MKLSEAIRLGATLRPQNRGDFTGTRIFIERRAGFPWFRLTKRETTCAFGAAIEAANVKFTKQVVEAGTPNAGRFRGSVDALTKDTIFQVMQTPPQWLTVMWAADECPQCGLGDVVLRLITHLNDGHKWSRESIAAFVEAVEVQNSALAAQEIQAWKMQKSDSQ